VLHFTRLVNGRLEMRALTLTLYPDPSRVPDEHVFRANCRRSQDYVLRQGEQHCNGLFRTEGSRLLRTRELMHAPDFGH